MVAAGGSSWGGSVLRVRASQGAGCDAPYLFVQRGTATPRGAGGARGCGTPDELPAVTTTSRRRRTAVPRRPRGGAGPCAGAGVVLGVVHRLDDVLAHDVARVEVAQLEVGVLRAELLAHLVARGVGDLSQPAQEPPACRARSGSRSGPKTSTATKAITASSGSPTPNTASVTCWRGSVRAACRPDRGRGRPARPRSVQHRGRRRGRVGVDDRLAGVAALAQDESSGISPRTFTS